MGLDDMRHPYRRLGVPFTAAFRVQADPASTAIERIRALGLDPADVRHIACTHLDLDHAGGLPDFPDAEVHVFAPEKEAAVKPSLRDRLRYPSCHFDHGPKWAHPHGRRRRLVRVRERSRASRASTPRSLLIPLVGHSRGHSGIAVRDGDGWILHCGDAYFHRNEVADSAHLPARAALLPEPRWRPTTAPGTTTRSDCASSPASTATRCGCSAPTTRSSSSGRVSA